MALAREERRFKPPQFRVKFYLLPLDLDHQQGLIAEANGKRYAIRVQHNEEPSKVAQSLRELADWIDQAGG